ncbi:hypothetical protein F5141DRAFT_984690, partial [Pisolithus sp. B1]
SRKSVNTTNRTSFLLTSQSQSQATYRTQDTVYSDENTSSVARFSNFQSSLHTVTSLSSLRHTLCRQDEVNVLVAILVVDTVKVKSGPRAGQESSILELIFGDEGGCVCRLTAWRDTAEVWDG